MKTESVTVCGALREFPQLSANEGDRTMNIQEALVIWVPPSLNVEPDENVKTCYENGFSRKETDTN